MKGMRTLATVGVAIALFAAGCSGRSSRAAQNTEAQRFEQVSRASETAQDAAFRAQEAERKATEAAQQASQNATTPPVSAESQPVVVEGLKPKTIINYGMSKNDLAVTPLPPGRRTPLKYWPEGK
jgi:hypothetical protein